MSSVMPQFSNVVAWAIQVGCVALAALAVSALFRVRHPATRYAFWRAVLALCLLLPWVPMPRAVSASGAVSVVTSVVAEGRGVPGPVDEVPFDWAGVAFALIGAGAGVRVAWLAFGYTRLRRLRRAGISAADHEFSPVQAALGTRADIRYVREVRQPVTFGLTRPVVLLPEALRGGAAATRHAIAAHELVHVRRRDWCWVITEELVRSVLWFHPVMWWLISRVQHTREEVVDAKVVALTGRRREYVEALLAFADGVPLAPAPAFARRRQLFRRIVLLSTEDVMSLRRTVVSALVMLFVVLAAVAAAARTFPLRASEAASAQSSLAALLQPPGPFEQSARRVTDENAVPKRLYGDEPQFPQAATGKDTSAAVTLRVTVDPAGNVAEVRLGGVTFSRGDISGTVSAGGFDQFVAKAVFKNASGMVITAESMRPMLEAFIESAADAVSRWHFEAPRDGAVTFLTTAYFNNGEVSTASASAQRAAVKADGALRVGGNVTPPLKVKDVKPVYPPEAKEAGVQGVVIAEVRVEPDGRVGDATILRSIPALDAAALDAIRQWEFVPTHLNGVAVPVIMTVTIQFTMQ